MSEAEKLADFRKYDFDNDQAWQEYMKNVEIPAGREDGLLKLKAKWYKRNVDDSVSVESLVASPQATKPQSDAPKPAPQSFPKVPSETYTRRTTPSGSGFLPKRGTPERTVAAQLLILFGLHLALIGLAFAYLVPFVPHLSFQAYAWFLRFAIVTQAFKVFLKYSIPEFSLDGLKKYAATVFASTDLQYMMLALLFTTVRPMALVLVPFVNVAVYHAMAYASQAFSTNSLWQKYGSKAHAWLRGRQTQALGMNAVAEVGIGFMLVALLLTSQRSILAIYLYWNMLRMRYNSPESSSYHRQVWQLLDSKTRPYRSMVPILDQGIGYISRWFNSV